MIRVIIENSKSQPKYIRSDSYKIDEYDFHRSFEFDRDLCKSSPEYASRVMGRIKELQKDMKSRERYLDSYLHKMRNQQQTRVITANYRVSNDKRTELKIELMKSLMI